MPKLLRRLVLALVVISLVSISTAQLVAATVQSAAAAEHQKDAALEKFASIRHHIETISKPDTPSTYRMIRHTKRLAKLIDIAQMKDYRRARAALAALDIEVTAQVREGIRTTTITIEGRKRVLTRPAPALPALPESPDGSSTSRALQQIPESLEEAEWMADMAIAEMDALEAEAQATTDDAQQWIYDHPTLCPVPTAFDTPDGSSAAAVVSTENCIERAFDIIRDGISAVAGWVMSKLKVRETVGVLRTLITGYWASYASGQITIEVMVSMAGGALYDFVAGLNLGWALGLAAAGVLAYSAGVFLYECLPLPIVPEPEPIY